MGKKTKGVDVFKKYINPSSKKRKPSEHDESFEEIKGKSGKIRGLKKDIKF
jgi:hypothetical protein